jgi:hypothetical protein
MQNQYYNVDILINGKPAKQYFHEGKLFIEAKDGTEYEIKIENNSWSRILAVGSVDGQSFLTGKEATKEDAGYIVPMRGSLRVKGFRINDKEVGAFKFCKKEESYAKENLGDTKTCGVIGVAFWTEKVKPIVWVYKNNVEEDFELPQKPKKYPFTPYEPIWKYSDSTGGNHDLYGTVTSCNFLAHVDDGQVKEVSARDLSNIQKKTSFDMGSTFGSKKESKVTEVEFERGYLVQTVEIYYASREALIAMGVPVNQEVQVAFPQAFPGKYCSPPKHWKG